jgi:hypothetical protein
MVEFSHSVSEDLFKDQIDIVHLKPTIHFSNPFHRSTQVHESVTECDQATKSYRNLGCVLVRVIRWGSIGFRE